MKRALFALVIAASFWVCKDCRAQPKAVPARAVQIEKKFGLVFLDTLRLKDLDDQQEFIGWEFGYNLGPTDWHVTVFIVPVNATDTQVLIAQRASQFTALWIQNWLNLAGKGQPSPTPKPSMEDHI